MLNVSVPFGEPDVPYGVLTEAVAVDGMTVHPEHAVVSLGVARRPDDDESAWRSDAADLAEREPELGVVFQHRVAHDEIEAPLPFLR